MTNPAIPVVNSDEAVEAAAEWLPHSCDCEVRPERYCTCWHTRVDIMCAAIEAAAPHIREGYADAFEEGVEAGQGKRPRPNPYRSQT